MGVANQGQKISLISIYKVLLSLCSEAVSETYTPNQKFGNYWKHFLSREIFLRPVVISKNFNKGVLGATAPTFRVWPSSSHAHTFKSQVL